MKTIWKRRYLVTGILALLLMFACSVVQADPQKEAGSNDAFAMSVGKMAKKYKRQAFGAQSVSDPFSSGRLIVKGKSAGLTFDKYGAVDSVQSSSNIYLVQFETGSDAQEAYKALKKNKKVKYVEPDLYVGVNDYKPVPEGEDFLSSKEAAKSWGVSHINADSYAAYLGKRTKKSITVAVVDSGVSRHSLIGKRLLNGYDFVEADKNASDVFGHGTHVAGIIADSTPGLNVNILPVRVLNEYGGGDGSVIGAGIMYAADHGAKVINLSLGGRHSHYLEECVNYAIKKGCVVCASSGNGYGSTDNACPAHMKNVLVVGAIDQHDQHAEFSNCGSSLDVVAPGVGIRSSVPGGRFEKQDGTSMSCPFVSAAAAMYCLEYPSKSVSEIIALVRKHTRDLGSSGFDEIYGAGAIYLDVPNKTVKKINPASVKLSVSSLTLEPGEKSTVSANISPASATEKTVTWKSSNKAVASVSGGIITAKKPGTATITATTVNGRTASCKVTVKKAAAGAIYKEIPEATYDMSDSAKMKKAVRIKAGTNRLRGTNGYLKFTAPSAGTYEFTFNLPDEKGRTKASDIRVTGSAGIKEKSGGYLLYMDNDRVETQGGFYSLLYFCSAKTRKHYQSYDSDKITDYIVKRFARITLKKGKTIYIELSLDKTDYATYSSNLPAKLELTVKKRNDANVQPTSITLDKTKLSLKTGDSLSLTASVIPIYAKKRSVTWKSSKPDVVDVTDGKITALKAGTAVVTASTANGLKATCKITVQKSATASYTKIPEARLAASDAVIIKKAVLLNTGVNKLSLDSQGYVKYTAPSDGTYQFTFTAVNRTPRDKYGYVSLAGAAVCCMRTKYGIMIMDESKVETQGGYYNYLNFRSSKTESSDTEITEKKERTIPNRYAKVKLKKGQQLFIYLHSFSSEYSSEEGSIDIPLSMKVTVKRA